MILRDNFRLIFGGKYEKILYILLVQNVQYFLHVLIIWVFRTLLKSSYYRMLI